MINLSKPLYKKKPPMNTDPSIDRECEMVSSGEQKKLSRWIAFDVIRSIRK